MLVYTFALIVFNTFNIILCEANNNENSIKIINAKYDLSNKIVRIKRSENFQVPEISLDNTFLDEADIKEIQNEKLPPIPPNTKFIKYPYYKKFSNHQHLKHSPLRYAESIRNIPKKTEGGTEFYDSKNRLRCSEVQTDIDPIPDRIKNKKPPDDEDDEEKNDDEESDDEDNDEEDDDEENVEPERNKRQLINIPLVRRKRGFEQHKEQPRLKGLGDKIDCFKEKYFGRDPLDSPFFDEDVIDPPEFFEGFPSKALNSPLTDDIVFSQPKPISIKKLPVQIKSSYQPKVKINDSKPNLTDKRSTENISNDDDEEEGEIIYGKNKDIVSLPEFLFDKYLQSKDPRVSVYGDVMGNIRANLDLEEQHNSHSNTSPNKITHVLGQNGNKYVLVPNPLNVNVNNNAGFYKNTRNKYPKLSKERDYIKSYNRYKPNGYSQKHYHIIHRHKRSTKVYQTIGRKERQAQHYSETNNNNYNDQLIPTEDSDELPDPNIENDATLLNNYTNHRKFYTPITTSNVISPDQLKIEYILRAAAELQRTDEILNKTLMLVHKNVDKPYVNVDNLRNNISINNDNKQNYTTIKRFNSNPSTTTPSFKTSTNIFDVSAYLPKPIYLSSYNLRHNYSSKYLDSYLNPLNEEKENATESYENNNHNGTFRHSIEVHPSVTLSPVLLSTPAYTNIRTTPILSPQSSIPRGRRRGHGYTTTTTESYIIFPPYSEDYSTLASAYETTENIQSTTQQIPLDETTTLLESNYNPVGYWPKYSQNYTDASYEDFPLTTQIPVTSKAPLIRVKNRGRRPKRIKRPSTQPPNINRENQDSSIEDTTRKPTILQKTSTKRKTTVITNSRRYRDDEEPNLQYKDNNKDYDTLLETTTLPYKPRTRVPVKRARIVEEIKETTKLPNNSRKKFSQRTYPQDVSNSKKKKPFKETRKFVEDYQEEEIIQREKNPTFLENENYGPTLAKEVNNLSESSESYDSSDTGNDYVTPNEETTISQQSSSEEINPSENVLKPAEHLDETILKESESDGSQRETKQVPNVVDDEGLSARVLRSFASLFDLITTATPKFEKDPSERLYFYLKV